LGYRGNDGRSRDCAAAAFMKAAHSSPVKEGPEVETLCLLSKIASKPSAMSKTADLGALFSGDPAGQGGDLDGDGFDDKNKDRTWTTVCRPAMRSGWRICASACDPGEVRDVPAHG
jgi:hypothetical protein